MARPFSDTVSRPSTVRISSVFTRAIRSAYSRAKTSAVSPMMSPLTGSVNPISRPTRGERCFIFNFPNAWIFCPIVFALLNWVITSCSGLVK